MTNRERVGAALRRWRLSAGLRQEEAAARAGVSQSTISAAEGGIYSAQLLLQLVALYRPEPGDLAAEMLAAEEAHL
jgi:transcriptional regulator with XRE-family HTH domain